MDPFRVLKPSALFSAPHWLDMIVDRCYFDSDVAAQQGLAVGSTVPIWIDRSGAAVPEPTSSGDALKVATITAAMAVVVGTIVLAALWCLLRRITVFYNCAAWEREWREVAAGWSRSEDGRG